MPNRNYQNGRAREYRIKKRLEREGYTVFRQAGSHTKIDLIAIRLVTDRNKDYKTEYRFIQSKPTDYVAPKEREDIHNLEQRLGISIEILSR